MAARRLTRTVLLLVLVSPGLAVPADPGDVFREEITVTATGEATAVTDVPADVTVVDRHEIERSQQATIAELLRRVPGLLVLQSGGPGRVASVFTRGTESDQTLVLFDGVRLNSPYFGGYDWSLLPTAGLERVEVVRGPASALYGADALGGVVNLVPRQRRRPGFGVDALAEVGEGSWRRLETTLTAAGKGWDLLASGFDRSGSGALPNSDFGTTQGLVDAGLVLGAGLRIGLLAQDLEAEVGIPFDGATLTPRRRQWADQTIVAVPVHARVSEAWTIEGSLARVDRSLRFVDPEDAFGYTSGYTEARSLEARLLSRHRAGRHTLSWGGEWRRDRVDDRSSYGVSLAGARQSSSGLLVQDVWRVAEPLRLVAGLRWDHADRWGGQLSPRLHLGWAPAPGWEIRAGWGEAFRQPSLGELYFPLSGNPDLEPERGRTAELGVVRAFTADRGHVAVTAFSTRLSQLIDFDYVSYRFRNIQKARIHGLEAVTELVLTPRLGLTWQLTWLDTAGGDGQPLLRRPRLAGALVLGGSPLARLDVDLAMRWLGARDDLDPVSFARVRVGGSATLDAALAWQVGRTVALTTRVSNLLDRRLDEVLGYPAPGRRLAAGMRVGLP